MKRRPESAAKLLAGLLLVVLGAASASAQTVFYVDAGAGGTGTCTAPFSTIDEALTAASAAGGATEIRIAGAAGGRVYNESGLTIDFSNVALKGGYDRATWTGPCNDAAIEGARPTPPDPTRTVIDGGLADRLFNVLPQLNGMNELRATNVGIVFDGLTLRNGQPAADGAGGALLILNSEVSVTNSVLAGNSSRGHFFGGGAVYMAGYYTNSTTYGGAYNRASLTLVDSTLENNQTGDGSTGSGIGGALFALDFNVNGAGSAANPQSFVNALGCTFRNNISNGGGTLANTVCTDLFGAPNTDCDGDGTDESCTSSSLGGGVVLQNTTGTFDGNTFDGNVARSRQISRTDFSGNGGGMATLAFGSPFQSNAVLTNNTFLNNVAQAGLGAGQNLCGGVYNAWGGALYMSRFDRQIVGNNFISNRADSGGNSGRRAAQGGAIFIAPLSRPVIAGNTFQGNLAVAGGGLFSAWGGAVESIGGEPVITNNTFEGNVADSDGDFTAYGGGLAALAMTGPYPQVTGNTFNNNSANGAANSGTLQAIGGGAAIGVTASTALVADNKFTNNHATTIIGSLRFSGFVLANWLFNTGGGSTSLITNNLIADNDGVGALLLGYDATQHSGARLFNNTVARNAFGGLAFQFADDVEVDSNILSGNDTTGSGFGDLVDMDLFGDGALSTPITLRRNIIGVPPAPGASTDIDFQLADAANMNQVGVDPQFVAGPLGGYYLDPGSSAVDAGAVPSAIRDFEGPRAGQEYDLDMDGQRDSLAKRTTDPGEAPDLCNVDLGYHYLIGTAAPDADGDTVPDAIEAVWGSDPNDSDSDDDGVPDGLDCGGDVDGDGTPAVLDCDSDGDGLRDGTETGVTMPDPGTDTTATCDTSNAYCGDVSVPAFVPDADPTTKTDPLNPDSDGGGEPDGCEDENQDGRCDGCSDPNPCPFSGVDNEQDPNRQSDDDPDGDCVPFAFEGFLLTGNFDADSDDDGLTDGQETGLDPSGIVTGTNPAPPDGCDTDNDGLPDGLEAGIATPVADDPRGLFTGTDTSVMCGSTGGFSFVADSDAGATTTDPTVPDSDGDGCLDGAEDANANGIVDGAETDPNVADCAAGGALLSNATIMALTGGTASCGAQTSPAVATTITTACASPFFDPSAPTAPRLAAPMSRGTVSVGTPLTLAGEAAANHEPARLVLYEVGGTDSLRLTKVPRTSDIQAELQ